MCREDELIFMQPFNLIQTTHAEIITIRKACVIVMQLCNDCEICVFIQFFSMC